MLGFDIHYGEHVRTFVEFKSGINSFRNGAHVRSTRKNSTFSPLSSRLELQMVRTSSI
jgi:hypothetical protein